ncbi:MAG: hypothetical protein HY541_06190 [Deltaproteobacteria bacterium]|nr:hypothetical protein [Deltaproteobacteria bacterium]
MKTNFFRFVGAQIATFILMTSLWSGHLVLSAGCGGSGSATSSSEDDAGGGAGASGGTGSSLAVVEQVSVVDAADSPSSSLSAALMSIRAAVADLPADSDYNTDETNVFVEERSAEAFDMVNEILCMMDQTAYEDMVNLGDYLAYIDITQCESENDSVEGKGESSADGSSDSDRPEYEEWVVNSYRRDDSSPHIVAVWIHMGGGEFEPAMRIHARAEITEAKSDENPYGIFKMDFQSFIDEGDATDTTGEPLMKG